MYAVTDMKGDVLAHSASKRATKLDPNAYLSVDLLDQQKHIRL
jgi:hypothetical protein